MNELEIILQKINQRLEGLQESLGKGESKNFDEYQNVCGVIKGLLFVRRDIIDLKHNMETSDE
jgi:hypothetical protein